MKKLMCLALMALMAAAAGGCDDNDLGGELQAQPVDNGGPAVAVLDLNRVAEETGMAKKMQETLQSVQQQLGQQLEQTRQKARQRIQSLAQDMGEDPTDKQQQAFAREQANLQAALNRAQQRAQQGFTGLRGQLSARFGDAVAEV